MLLVDFRNAVQERVAREGHALASGAATSYEDYKKRVGYLKGLQDSLDILQELYKATPKEERGL
jgi:hypothetical protein